jgi:hypothetical protein
MPVDLPVLDYREYQKPLVRYMRKGRAEKTPRRAVWVAHRRSGKDVTCWEVLIEEAIQEVGTYYYCLPEFTHARRVIWEGMLNDGLRFLNLVPPALEKDRNETLMKITLVNGSVIQLVGSDQYDRLVGTNPKGIVFSEYSLTHPMAWQILRPILAANGGWVIFNGTPRGKNHFHEMLEMAKKDPTWFWSVDTVDTTGILSEEILKKEKQEMDIDVFNQEYYCSFDAATMGAYYSEQIMSLRQQNRVCKVPYDPKLLVYTASDPGDSVTAIVFFQVYGKEIRIIDAEEFYSPSLEHIFTTITSKPYQYATHFVPFDATVHKMNVGKSLMQQLLDLGLHNVQDLPQQRFKMDGIKLVQSAFASFWIDESLEKSVVSPLSSYAPKYSEIRHTFSKEPDHNWASHMSDSIRYMVIAIQDIAPYVEDDSPSIYIPSPRLG